jgi:transposase
VFFVKIRVVKTASNARAVQAVTYQNNRRIVVRHFGSCHTGEELKELLAVAHEWISEFAGQLSIFPNEDPGNLLHLKYCSFLGVYYTFFYDFIAVIQQQIGFGNVQQPLLNDLVTMRIFEPASKLRSIELLENYFGIVRQRKNYYKIAPKWLGLKEAMEAYVVAFARDRYAFEFDLVFYDVTTLYFEAFEEDALRRNGFSKDNKSQQPQILVALMVSKEGFPVGYEVFSGNTFEGHTIIPVIKAFVNKHRVQTLTVVADAAMISATNVEALIEQQLNYIVGARLGNLSNELIAHIDQHLIREDGRSIRLNTENGYLICSYSTTRYRKDKYEMEKQIEKAKSIVATPSKNRKVKFTKAEGQRVDLNENLIAKTQKLLGIKGYYTNLEDVWQITRRS